MLDDLDDTGEPVLAIARVDLLVDEALHQVDQFGADAKCAAGVDDVAVVRTQRVGAGRPRGWPKWPYRASSARAV